MEIKEDIELLFARIDDLCERAERGEMAVSVFLSPRELHFARRRLDIRHAKFLVFGGMAEAERGRIYILPEYMEDVLTVSELEAYGEDLRISALRVSGSGFSKLSHRDFMGSLLGLGIERSVIGDIIVTETGREAIALLIANNDALSISVELISSTDASQIAYATASFIMISKIFSRLASDNFFESLRPSI